MDPVEPTFACNLNAIPAEQRDAHIALARELFGAVLQMEELLFGYGFRLPNDAAFLTKTAEFIANERLCCPFFGFDLRLEPNNGALWLHITGSDGIKPFILAEFGDIVNPDVERHGNFREVPQ